MAKSKQKKKRGPSAVLKLMQDPMFRQRKEQDKTKYRRQSKHAGRADSRLHQKALNDSVFSNAA